MTKTTFSIFLIIFTLNSFGQTPNTINPAEKVYGLSQFWSDASYNFAYLDRIDKKSWDSTYVALIGDVQQTKNDYEYYRLMQKFCALLHDGHTQVYFPDTIVNLLNRYDFGQYRLYMTDVDSKAIVRNVNVSQKEEIPVGSEIIEVNGLSTQAYIDKYVKPYISESTPKTLEVQSIRAMFLGFTGDAYKVKFKKPNGDIVNINLTHAKPTDWAFYPPIKDKPLFEFRWINSDIAYIGLNSFNDAKVDTDFINKLPEIRKAKSLIVDLRDNGGGSGAVAIKIAQYFIKGNILYNEKIQTRKLISADKAIGSFLVATDTINGKPDWGLTKEQATKYYKAYIGTDYYTYENNPDTLQNVQKILLPTVFLTSYATASAAEDFLIFTDGQKQITRIGGYTDGSTGQPLQIKLPGGGSAWICTKKTFYPDGRKFVGIGVKPDIEVSQTVKDFIENKDAVLEKAINFLKTKTH